MPIMLSPAVYPLEVDVSNIIPVVATSIGATAGYSARGPLERTLVTNNKQLVDWYGTPTPGNYLHYTGLGFLQRSSQLWMKRVQNGALYGGVEIKLYGSSQANVAIAGTADPAAHTFGTEGLLAIFAPNPGVWNNRTAVKITNVDTVNHEFDIEFYEKDANDDYQLTHKATVSREAKKDGFGKNMYVGDLFPVADASPIQFIVIDNTTELDTVDPKAQSVELDLAGGTDGSAVTNSELTVGWDDFANGEDINVNILMSNGYTDETVLQKINTICSVDRLDCIGVLDTLYGQTAAQLVTWRKDTLGINSSYSAIYGSWLKVYDSYNDKIVEIPPSGHVGGVYAWTDYVTAPWFAPAGMNRGILSVVDLTKNWTKGERDALYQVGINPIRKHPAGGSAVWGQKTLQTKASATDRVNVRRMLIVIEKAITVAMEYFVFEPNDRNTRTFITNMIDSYMATVQAQRGVYEYKIVCDGTNNEGAIIDRNELHVDLYVKPTKAAEFIQLRTIITRTDVSFDEVIGAV